jgi:hypothetical protein
LRRILTARGTPDSIAGGAALGVFMAMTPALGLQMVTAFALATAMRVNKIVAMLMCWVTNPVTIVPIYYSCYRIGVWVLPAHRVPDARAVLRNVSDQVRQLTLLEFWQTFEVIFREMGRMFWPLIVGCLIVGTITATITYPVTYRLVVLYRRERALRGMVWRLRRAKLPLQDGTVSSVELPETPLDEREHEEAKAEAAGSKRAAAGEPEPDPPCPDRTREPPLTAE